MRTGLWSSRVCAAAALGAVSMCTAGYVWSVASVDAASDAEPAGVDRAEDAVVFEGVVVFKEDGRPAAGVPVVIAHPKNGYLMLSDGGLGGGGGDERVLSFFVKPNSRRHGQTLTDAEGRFRFSGLAGRDEPWNVAAGDADHGFALRTDVRPDEYSGKPLRLELEPPGWLEVVAPKSPVKGLRVSLAVGLAPVGEAAEAADVTGEDGDGPRIYMNWPALWNPGTDKRIRVGPLPGGQSYRVGVNVSGGKLPYAAAVFGRNVRLAPGATEELRLVPGEGGVVSGQVLAGDEKPLAGVNVMLRAADGLLVGTVTDAEGRYELRGVPEGEHKLELLRHARRTAPG